MTELYKYKQLREVFELKCTNGLSTWVYYYPHSLIGLKQMKNQLTKYKYDPKAAILPINSVVFKKSVVTASELRNIFGYYYQGYTWSIKNGHFLAADDRLQNLIDGTTYSTLTASEKNLAFTQCLSRVDLKDFDAGVALAELPETLSMLRRPLSSLDGLFKRFNRRVTAKYRAGIRKEKVFYASIRNRRALALEATAGTWLQMRYGVKPLISDISDIASLVEDGINKIGPTRVYSARGTSVTDVGFTVLPESAGNFPLTWSWPTRVVTKGLRREIRKVSYVTRYRANPWMEDAISLSRWGLSPTQAASLVYELIRLSFCVDWVTNFGSWLEAIRPKPELTIIDTCETTKWVHNYTLEHVRTTHNGVVVYGCEPGSTISATCQHMGRSAYTNQVAPTAQFRANGFRLLQQLDSLSLIYQSLSKRIQRYVGKNFRHI